MPGSYLHSTTAPAILRIAGLTEPKGNLVRHLQTLAALISGIVGGRSSNLPAIAGQVPGQSTRDSRVKKFSRWMSNKRIEFEIYFLPFADALLASLAAHTLVLAVDGSEVGRNCVALMASSLSENKDVGGIDRQS